QALLAVARRVLPDSHVLTIGTSAAEDGSHSVDVEAMEGFGVLRACALAGVPALELRAIANEIEEADRSRWHLAEALEELARALPALVRALSAA
ncbi:MAG: futalosine hydrolase, partial [Actinobacteria bacterium]|nr:futalosine hydrolase [Actinomycetota bacterium]